MSIDSINQEVRAEIARLQQVLTLLGGGSAPAAGGGSVSSRVSVGRKRRKLRAHPSSLFGVLLTSVLNRTARREDGYYRLLGGTRVGFMRQNGHRRTHWSVRISSDYPTAAPERSEARMVPGTYPKDAR